MVPLAFYNRTDENVWYALVQSLSSFISLSDTPFMESTMKPFSLSIVAMTLLACSNNFEKDGSEITAEPSSEALLNLQVNLLLKSTH